MKPMSNRVSLDEVDSHEIVLHFLSTYDSTYALPRLLGPGASGWSDCDAYAILGTGRSGYDRACAWIVTDQGTNDRSLPSRIRHALGHALGLVHPITTLELVSPASDPDILDYGVGDRFALGRIGAWAGR